MSSKKKNEHLSVALKKKLEKKKNLSKKNKKKTIDVSTVR